MCSWQGTCTAARVWVKCNRIDKSGDKIVGDLGEGKQSTVVEPSRIPISGPERLLLTILVPAHVGYN